MLGRHDFIAPFSMKHAKETKQGKKVGVFSVGASGEMGSGELKQSQSRNVPKLLSSDLRSLVKSSGRPFEQNCFASNESRGKKPIHSETTKDVRNAGETLSPPIYCCNKNIYQVDRYASYQNRPSCKNPKLYEARPNAQYQLRGETMVFDLLTPIRSHIGLSANSNIARLGLLVVGLSAGSW